MDQSHTKGQGIECLDIEAEKPFYAFDEKIQIRDGKHLLPSIELIDEKEGEPMILVEGEILIQGQS